MTAITPIEVSYEDRLRKTDWYVADCPLAEAQALIAEHHYAKGGSNTRVVLGRLAPRRVTPASKSGVRAIGRAAAGRVQSDPR